MLLMVLLLLLFPLVKHGGAVLPGVNKAVPGLLLLLLLTVNRVILARDKVEHRVRDTVTVYGRGHAHGTWYGAKVKVYNTRHA